MALVKHSKRTIRKACRGCASKELYWAHDTDLPGDRCVSCDVAGKWTLINLDGTRHADTCDRKRGLPSTDPNEEPAEPTPVTAPEPSPAAPASDVPPDAFAAFQAFMSALAPKVDRSEVEAMIKEQIDGVLFPTRTVVERASGSIEVVTGSHSQLGDVITDLMAGEHVLMVGPAGTGKSTIAEHAAKALTLPYYSISLSPMTPASQILGYMQAAGEYVRSLFREAYENGGVFHFDEFDNGHPSVLAVVNAALANGHMAFPDQMVKRHPDFRCVASANTYGKGADRQYVGRQQIDAATLDRFTVETINVDEALEESVCLATGLEAERVRKVLAYTRTLRRNAERKGMLVVISPRASIGMCRLIAAGKSWDAAVGARVRRGMSDSDWRQLTDGI